MSVGFTFTALGSLGVISNWIALVLSAPSYVGTKTSSPPPSTTTVSVSFAVFAVSVMVQAISSPDVGVIEPPRLVGHWSPVIDTV